MADIEQQHCHGTHSQRADHELQQTGPAGVVQKVECSI